MEFLAMIIGAVFCFLIWIYPIIRIAASNRTSGGEKVAWLLLTIFVFWFAWIFYLLLAPLKTSHSKYRTY
ncbi:hypothetical protein [Glaciecola sp. 1036]|uniref:hypothetical protein n=1 Tax=Alteromonadaceae TaxID=72275 RepID=UPI003D0057B8